jgi:hypothetical protein
MTPTERFMAKVSARPDGCWQWMGATDRYGYGLSLFYGRRERKHMAHRVAYEQFVGPIPEGLVIDHLCRNKGCVNPDHLEPVTIGENVLRGETIPARNLLKTHCHRGHEFTPESTYYRPDKPHVRNCRIRVTGSSRRRQGTPMETLT